MWGGFIIILVFLITTTTLGEYTTYPTTINTSYNTSIRPNISTEQDTSVVVGFPGKSFIIPLYTLIFFLSITGNFLVIITIATNRRMLTVTNLFLLNLAIADLLLGVFCMPVTLIGQLLQNFIFGNLMCKIIPYFQAVSVSVGVWTLVAISLERYFAICRPLQSRKWQTRSHAYKTILTIWLLTLSWNIPITVVSQLQSIRDTGRSKCREDWPNVETEKIFNLILDFLLLFLPLCIMIFSYSLIVSKLWKRLQTEIIQTRSFHYHKDTSCNLPSENSIELSTGSHFSTAKYNVTQPKQHREPNSEVLTLNGGKGIVVRWKKKDINFTEPKGQSRNVRLERTGATRQRPGASQELQNTHRNHKQAIRSSYTGKSIESKKKVIRMLFVLVAEFFVCWTPLHLMHTWYLFSPEEVYSALSPVGVSLIQLLAYASSCSNPITYCFMNRRFRQAFLKLLQKLKSKPKPRTANQRPNSDLSGNDSLIYALQGSTLNNKSEVVVLAVEDRV